MDVQVLEKYAGFLKQKHEVEAQRNEIIKRESETLSQLGTLARQQPRNQEAIYDKVDDFFRIFSSEGVPAFIRTGELVELEVRAQPKTERGLFAHTQLESVIFHTLDRYGEWIGKLNRPLFRGDRQPMHLTGATFLPLLKIIPHIADRPSGNRRRRRKELLSKINALCPEHPLKDP